MKLLLTATVVAAAAVNAHATVTSVDATQVGGFYADGSADNAATFQNYFVGYGTTPGFPRTEERRSFFTFDLSGISGPVTSASFSLFLPAFGLIFGTDCLGADPCTGPLPMVDDPGTPWDDTDPGAWPKDTVEEFVLGHTPFSSAIVTDTMLPSEDPGGLDKKEVFESFDDSPVAGPLAIMDTDPLDFSSGPIEFVITLDATGIALINDAIAAGGDFVLTGFMPSWSFEDRMTPLGDDLVEKSELMFGLSDLVTDGMETSLTTPFLEITTSEVPLPAAFWLFGSAALSLFGLRFKKSNH